MGMGGMGSNMTLNKRPPQESQKAQVSSSDSRIIESTEGICSSLAPQPRSRAGKQDVGFIPGWKKEGRIENRMSREYGHAKVLKINASLWDSGWEEKTSSKRSSNDSREFKVCERNFPDSGRFSGLPILRWMEGNK